MLATSSLLARPTTSSFSGAETGPPSSTDLRELIDLRSTGFRGFQRNYSGLNASCCFTCRRHACLCSRHMTRVATWTCLLNTLLVSTCLRISLPLPVAVGTSLAASLQLARPTALRRLPPWRRFSFCDACLRGDVFASPADSLPGARDTGAPSPSAFRACRRREALGITLRCSLPTTAVHPAGYFRRQHCTVLPAIPSPPAPCFRQHVFAASIAPYFPPFPPAPFKNSMNYDTDTEDKERRPSARRAAVARARDAAITATAVAAVAARNSAIANAAVAARNAAHYRQCLFLPASKRSEHRVAQPGGRRRTPRAMPKTAREGSAPFGSLCRPRRQLCRPRRHACCARRGQRKRYH